MRRTLLAVGIAVLVSILFAPHTNRIVFGSTYHPDYYVADGGYWAHGYWDDGSFRWYWWPIFWNDTRYVAWRDFWTQTAFAALLAAVVVNPRKSWRRKPRP